MSEPTGFNRLKQCRHGTLLYNINDMYVGRSIDLYGEFSQGECQVFEQFIRPGDVVMDVGANIGAHTLFFAKAVGLSGAVLAFEPQRIVFQTLCANMALNSITNTQCMQLAVSDQPAVLRTAPVDYAKINNFGGLPLGQYDKGELVEVVRLDRYALPSCKLIKIDVEGMELPALRGAATLIAKHKPFLYVENDRKENAEALVRYIDSLGYHMYWHRPPLYNPDNFFHNPINVFERIVSLNMLCVHSSQSHLIQGMEQVKLPGIGGK